MLENLANTNGCGSLTVSEIPNTVQVFGWVHRIRDHGGLLFVDIRDRSGIVQTVFDPAKPCFETAKEIKPEYCVKITGIVRKRPAGTENTNIPTGEIEIFGENVEILNASKVPPFTIADEQNVDETLRLKYRYLDLRRDKMRENFILRHKMLKAVRDFFDANSFLEIETPMLIKSTPEGARDFIVPSRLNPGRFYALPQSPQLFKQLLMVSGFERYFQLARCFRDEDLRKDRQPEFTQIDVEASFVDVNDILTLVEAMLSVVLKNVFNQTLSVPFHRLSYDDAMEKYGNDKPDTRFELPLVSLTDIVKNCEFKVFAVPVSKGGVVKGLNAKGCGGFSRKEIDDLTKHAMSLGAKGLAWIIVEPDGKLSSPIVKFFKENEISGIKEKLNAQNGDLLLFVADEESTANKVLSQLRLYFGEKLNLVPKDGMHFVWVVDFPMFEHSETEKRLVACNHPFTAPKDEDIPILDSQPEKAKAKAYDLVLNGTEIAGGSIRIHSAELQKKIFHALQMTEEDAQKKFGFLLEALQYGAPPHGGFAFGFDRLMAILCGEDSIRDVIAFPKTQSGVCPLTDAPYDVSEKQLKEVFIKTVTEAQSNTEQKKQ